LAKELKVPEEIPTDELVLVLVIQKKDGEKVLLGEAVFEIETSKTTYEICAEASGTLNHKLEVGQELKSGEIIGFVSNTEDL
jgi:pyruvate/2-oxoglutarate dehydrogenase complex dihydrolipoamide acyltransferase (E2) component